MQESECAHACREDFAFSFFFWMIRYHFGQRARGATNKDLPPEGWPNFGLVHARRWRGRYRVAVLLACGAAA